MDRVNSRERFARARAVLFRHLESCPDGSDPIGLVLIHGPVKPAAALTHRGVVFPVPVLLPDGQFVPLEGLLARGQGLGGPRRGRLQRSRPTG